MGPMGIINSSTWSLMRRWGNTHPGVRPHKTLTLTLTLTPDRVPPYGSPNRSAAFVTRPIPFSPRPYRNHKQQHPVTNVPLRQQAPTETQIPTHSLRTGIRPMFDHHRPTLDQAPRAPNSAIHNYWSLVLERTGPRPSGTRGGVAGRGAKAELPVKAK